MIKLDLGDDVAFEVTFQGQTYQLTEPTLKQISAIRAGEGTNLVEFLTGIGLPESVAEAMPMSKVQRLVVGITDQVSKKK